MISIEKIEKLIKELRKKEDLDKFRDEHGEEFCKEHHIQPSQLNFLLSVVATERFKKANEDKKHEIISKRKK